MSLIVPFKQGVITVAGDVTKEEWKPRNCLLLKELRMVLAIGHAQFVEKQPKLAKNTRHQRTR